MLLIGAVYMIKKIKKFYLKYFKKVIKYDRSNQFGDLIYLRPL